MTLTRLRNEALKAAVKGQELYMQISGADVLHLLGTIDCLKAGLEELLEALPCYVQGQSFASEEDVEPIIERARAALAKLEDK